MRYYPVLCHFLALLFVICLCGCKQNVSDPVVDDQLSQLLENKDFFRLREQLPQAKNKLSPERRLFYEAYCNNAFGEEEKSNEQIRTLLEKYGDSLHDTLKIELLEIQAQNYGRIYKYAEAADTYMQLITDYASVADSTHIEAYKNVWGLWYPLRDVPPQRIERTKDVSITFIRDGRYARIPTTCGGVTEELIFDTGANFSMVSQSIAEQMGLTLYDADIEVGSSTTIKIQSKLGVADSLYLGDLLVENATFLVMPDETFYIPQIDYHIKGTIGFPVMYQMEEMHLYSNDVLTIPAKSQKKELNNLFLDHLHPVVRLYSGAESLLFTLDTGANNTELSRKYYEGHKQYVEENAELRERHKGGMGGVIEIEEYGLKDFPYTLGSKSGNLAEVSVLMDTYDFNESYDGNLGQDILGAYDKLILNFKDMYVELE